MTPYVLSCIPKSDVELLEKVRLIVQAFPDGLDYGKNAYGEQINLSCHILAHAMGKLFKLEVEDGYFWPNYQHSWLKTTNGHIIDVYPVGIFEGPFLVEQTMSFISPGRHLYQPDERIWQLVQRYDMQAAIELAYSTAVHTAQKIGIERINP
jgi:hypothetical protein